MVRPVHYTTSNGRDSVDFPIRLGLTSQGRPSPGTGDPRPQPDLKMPLEKEANSSRKCPSALINGINAIMIEWGSLPTTTPPATPNPPPSGLIVAAGMGPRWRGRARANRRGGGCGLPAGAAVALASRRSFMLLHCVCVCVCVCVA